MKKILVDKSEPAASVVEKILAAPDSDIVLVIPRNARIAESLGNFHLLNREADATGKSVMIESVDEEVLALAKAAKIPATHPLFSSSAQGRSLSDIVPSSRSEEDKPVKRKKFAFKPETPEEREMIVEAEAEEVVRGEEFKPPSRRVLVFGIALVALFVLGAWAVGAFFARAEVRINFSEIPWENQGEVLATKTVAEINPADRVIPAEVFRDKRNLTQFFPGTGRAEVAEKATGRLVIYNAYSSQSQTLVATTRFETPDGKIFRLDNQVIVPGAEIRDGEIIPSSIETGVTADKAGEDWNVGPIEKLTIPGFEGSPRFNGFYGALPRGTSGGFIGEKAVPTDADVAAAEEKMTQILRSSLENNLLSGRPSEFKILDGTSETEVTRMTVQKSTDAQGNFSIIGEAEFRAIGFREEDLRAMLLDLAVREYPESDFKNLEFSYSGAETDYDGGEIKFSVEARGELVPAFSGEDFRAQVAGQDLSSVQSQILKLPRLADAEVSVWPIWLRRLPEDPGKITLTLE